MLINLLLIYSWLEFATDNLIGSLIFPLRSIIRHKALHQILIIALLTQLHHNLPQAINSILIHMLKPSLTTILFPQKMFFLQPVNSFLNFFICIFLTQQLFCQASDALVTSSQKIHSLSLAGRTGTLALRLCCFH